MKNYPTDVSDSQWQVISKFLDTKRNRKYELREIVNAVLYMVKAGCQWRMLPGDFAPWKLVYYYFDTWKKNGIFELIHESLVEKTRIKQGKKAQPTVGIIDAQSVKSTFQGVQLRPSMRISNSSFLTLKITPATTYSPDPLRDQYHRPWWA